MLKSGFFRRGARGSVKRERMSKYTGLPGSTGATLPLRAIEVLDGVMQGSWRGQAVSTGSSATEAPGMCCFFLLRGFFLTYGIFLVIFQRFPQKGNFIPTDVVCFLLLHLYKWFLSLYTERLQSLHQRKQNTSRLLPPDGLSGLGSLPWHPHCGSPWLSPACHPASALSLCSSTHSAPRLSCPSVRHQLTKTVNALLAAFFHNYFQVFRY